MLLPAEKYEKKIRPERKKLKVIFQQEKITETCSSEREKHFSKVMERKGKMYRLDGFAKPEHLLLIFFSAGQGS